MIREFRRRIGGRVEQLGFVIFVGHGGPSLVLARKEEQRDLRLLARTNPPFRLALENGHVNSQTTPLCSGT